MCNDCRSSGHIDTEFRKEWDKAEEIVNKLKRKLQFPEGGPDNGIHLAAKETEVKAFKDWGEELYNLSCDLIESTELIQSFGNECEESFNKSEKTHDPKDLVQAPKTL